MKQPLCVRFCLNVFIINLFHNKSFIHHFSIICDSNEITVVKEIEDNYMPAKRAELRFEFSLSSPKANDPSTAPFL